MRRKPHFLSPLLLASLLLAAPAALAEQKRVRGFVLEIYSPTSFQLDGYTVVRARPDSPADPAGALTIGAEVEATGEYDAPSHHLFASRLRVSPLPSGAVRGQGVLEYLPEASPGELLLSCDGRRVRVSEVTRLFRREDPSQPVSLADFQGQLAPGSYIDYQGTLSPEGTVETTKIVFWKKATAKAEAELLERYQPRLELPARADSPTLLSVGSNHYRLFPDPVVQSYVEQVGARLVAPFWRLAENEAGRERRFWFFVVDEGRPGATAYPSGVIVLHSGLLPLVENEAQLAFLLAHELAHVTQEHVWRQRAYHRRKLLVLRWGSAPLGWVVEEALRKGYERELENQADRLALTYMARAGYDPRESYRFLRRLQQLWRGGLSPLLWGSHASFSHRQRSLMAVLRQTHRDLEFNRLTVSAEEFAVIKMRLPQTRIQAAAAEAGSGREKK